MKRTSLCLSLLTLCAVVSISPNASAVPGQVAYTGYLQKTVAGKLVPYTGSIPDITFNLHETLTGGASQWQETVYNVNVDNGVFFVVLGKKISPGPRLRSGKQYFAEIVLGKTTMVPRLPLRTVPHAFSADNCTGDITPRSVSIGVQSMAPWAPSYRVLQLGGGASLAHHQASEYVVLGNNYYEDATDHRQLTGTAYASYYRQKGGRHEFVTTNKKAGAGGKITRIHAMTITNGGNVGIRTTTPSLVQPLTVNGNIEVSRDATGPRVGLVFKNPTGFAQIMTGGGHSNGLAFYTGSETIPANASMVINTKGYVGIGTTSPKHKLNIANGSIGLTDTKNGTAAAISYDNRRMTLRVDSGGTNGFAFQSHHSGAYSDRLVITSSGHIGIGYPKPTYRLDVNGDARCNTLHYQKLSQWSDRRLKRDIRSIRGALATVNRLRGRTFRWRRSATGDRDLPETRQMGVIAQEVEQVVPEVVHRGPDGFKGVDYPRLVPLLIEAIKEQDRAGKRQMNVVARQAKKIASLEQRLAALEKRIKR